MVAPIAGFPMHSVLVSFTVYFPPLTPLSRLSSISPIISPLFGIKEPTFVPINWILAFFGGHFSPVVGYFEDVNLVAIFDVNHTYSTFFVTPERFYDAIHTFDVTSGKARGLVVTECV